MDTEKEELTNTTEEVVEEQSTELDFEELVKTRVEEAVKPLQESLSDLSTKYNELLELSKKKTVIRVNKAREETKQEKLEREANKLYETVKNLII